MKTFSIELENRLTEIITAPTAETGGILPDPAKCLIITDEMVMKTEGYSRLFGNAGFRTLALPGGEVNKSMASVLRIAEEALRYGMGRDVVILGAGGGVICDMAAFAASIYMRGARLVLVPTTLLAMVDASIGGKTGVNFLEKKNMIGSFYPAEKVIVCTDFLESLPAKEYKSGLAEIIKHGFLSGGRLLDTIEKERVPVLERDKQVMEDLIYKSLIVKADYVKNDFREKGIRAHLNFGHTFGHALESSAGLGRLSHGEAVAWGMNKAFLAGRLMGVTGSAYAGRAEKLLKDYGYDLDFRDFDIGLFMEALSADKKKEGDVVRFILQKNPGETVIKPVEPEILEKVLALSDSEDAGASAGAGSSAE